MNELVELVQQWSINKGLDKADSRGQFLKIVEEVGEVSGALARSDIDNLKEEIGDVVVTLIIYNQQYFIDTDFTPKTKKTYGSYIEKNVDWHMLSLINAVSSVRSSIISSIIWQTNQCLEYLDMIAIKHDLTLEDCLQSAYTKISCRTGKMLNGVWIKSEDEKKPDYGPKVWPKNKADSEGDSDIQMELK